MSRYEKSFLLRLSHGWVSKGEARDALNHLGQDLKYHSGKQFRRLGYIAAIHSDHHMRSQRFASSRQTFPASSSVQGGRGRPVSWALAVSASLVSWVASAAEVARNAYTQPSLDSRGLDSYGNYFTEDGSRVQSPYRTWQDRALRWGPVSVHAGLGLDTVYDDRIVINGQQRQKDLIWTFLPSLTLGMGDYRGTGNSVTLDYRPSYLLFTDKSDFNTFDQDVRLAGRYTFSKLSVGLSQGYLDQEGNLVETGNRVRSRIYQTFLGMDYAWTDKTSFTVNGRQNITDYETLNEIKDWLGEVYANWSASDKLRLSLGGGYGARDVKPGPNEEYEQALLKAQYLATEKWRVDANVGMEFHQFQTGDNQGPLFVFGLGTTWIPREGWNVSIEGHRRQQTSISNGSLSLDLTGVSGLIQKRFLERYAFNLAGSFDHVKYRSNISTVSTARNDDYWSVTPSFDVFFTERWKASVFYLYRENLSEGGGTSFSNNQVGLRTSYQF